MPARANEWMAAGLAVALLAACGEREDPAKTAQSPAERVAAALDPCAEGGGFARSVCDDAGLSALAGQVRETLVAEVASVTPAGGQLLVQNEQRWREAQRVACGIVDPDAPPTPEQAQCLETELRARVEEARTAVQQVGGYTFQRVELVDATPVTAEVAASTGLGDAAPAAVVRDIRFPRIDGAQTPQIQRFNELVAQQPQFSLGDATDEIVDYQIAFAGPEIISVRFTTSENTLGAAHPNNNVKAVTVLMTTGEVLGANHVFRPGSGWQTFITDRALAEITRQFRDYEFVPPERDVRESATKPHLWLITEEGLVILFPPYSFGGSHAMGGTEVAIPWADLAPYLNPNAPAPIRRTA